jgi:hypothetical protein
VPYEVDGLPGTPVQVRYPGEASAAYALSLVAAAPAIFAGAIVNDSGSVNGPSSSTAAGRVVVFYLTGDGETNPKGRTLAFYGEAPGMVTGVLQANVQVPGGLPGGNLPLLVSFGGIGAREA